MENSRRLITWCVAVGLTGSAWAQDLEVVHPNFIILNTFDLVSLHDPQLDQRLGDIWFSADGTTAFVVDRAQQSDATLWSLPVTRSVSGDVTGFGTPTLVFTENQLETGLAQYDGDTTWFFRSSNLGIGQRDEFGNVEYFEPNYDVSGGGMTIIPPGFPNSSQLLSADEEGRDVWRHPVSNDGDGTYTIGAGVRVVVNVTTTGEDLYDLAYVQTGVLEGSLLAATEVDEDGLYGELRAYALDPATGQAVGGLFADGVRIAQTSSCARNHSCPDPFGLDIDPVTGNIWVMVNTSSSTLDLYQLVEVLFADGFEDGDTSAWQ